ncbi:MAG TPA: hypothetical protein EYP59_22915 [Thiotrichaceae bacterium]|nr:hypothetical protein [Thiotrichaceae bacterium]
MRKQLANITLPEGTHWANEFAWAPVRQQNLRTTGGGMVYLTQKLTKGQPIEIEFAKDAAWLKYSEMQQLIDLANKPGETLLLTWDNKARVVIFNHAQTPYEFYPLIPYLEPTLEQQRFFGKIHLITA